MTKLQLIIFFKEVVRQLLSNNSQIKINNNKKTIIIEKAGNLTTEINKANKEIIIVETFFYDIINILYDDSII